MNPLASDIEYRNALSRIDEIISQNPVPKSPEFEELDKLGELVSAYEDIHFPIEE